MQEREQIRDADEGRRQVTPNIEQELIPGTSSITHSIAHALVVKDEDLFFVSEPDGNVPLKQGHGFGLYYHDCRFLNGYELRLAGRRPHTLVSNAGEGFTAVFGLSNPLIETSDGTVVDKHSLEIKGERSLDSDQLALYDRLTFTNLSFRPLNFAISLSFSAGFEDVFAVRGANQQRRGKLLPPSWDGDVLNFAYEGADGINRRLSVRLPPDALAKDGSTAHFPIRLRPKESTEIYVAFLISESPVEGDGIESATSESRHSRSESRERRDRWREGRAHFKSDSLTLNTALDRSLRDLEVLRSHLGRKEYFAAGVPWFVALFGRDSIIAALQTLAYDTQLAEETIRLLANYQGREVNEWREEEPGKILHELRVGEMANLGEVPHTPYYGTIDATPLFLILLGRHAMWTGDLTLFNELRLNVEAALDWVAKFGDMDGDGYVEYLGKSEKGLFNQGWKDSSDCIVNADGTLATPPIALCEVQGYVYEAKILMADLFARAGDAGRADVLKREANELRQRFNRDFWLADGYFALALQDGKRPAAVLSSNAGHALWTGIADPEKARQTAEHLMGTEMFNGWGIRTLAEREQRYNPLGYHLGTVWPHDNSLIAAGMRRYGIDGAAMRVFVSLLEAAVNFDGHRLPELFAGFRKEDYSLPVAYPVACIPQAWAAGTVPYILSSLLGLEPEAFENRLRIVRPILPDFIRHVEIKRLRVGAASVDLRFERVSHGIEVRTLKLNGQLSVDVEP